ncbi:hypothetical protein EYF80_006682 [Liparis tanakae]|uniref:Uncharacterized protein n=1 Tax=Liparis tanakae TaxID=230148 RepID=A0A4Z2IYK9_9TELE|nr:hypothetical protein EYF80_006682 [Liparis tanakae]
MFGSRGVPESLDRRKSRVHREMPVWVSDGSLDETSVALMSSFHAFSQIMNALATSTDVISATFQAGVEHLVCRACRIDVMLTIELISRTDSATVFAYLRKPKVRNRATSIALVFVSTVLQERYEAPLDHRVTGHGVGPPYSSTLPRGSWVHPGLSEHTDVTRRDDTAPSGKTDIWNDGVYGKIPPSSHPPPTVAGRHGHKQRRVGDYLLLKQIAGPVWPRLQKPLKFAPHQMFKSPSEGIQILLRNKQLFGLNSLRIPEWTASGKEVKTFLLRDRSDLRTTGGCKPEEGGGRNHMAAGWQADWSRADDLGPTALLAPDLSQGAASMFVLQHLDSCKSLPSDVQELGERGDDQGVMCSKSEDLCANSLFMTESESKWHAVPGAPVAPLRPAGGTITPTQRNEQGCSHWRSPPGASRSVPEASPPPPYPPPPLFAKLAAAASCCTVGRAIDLSVAKDTSCTLKDGDTKR